MVKIIEKHFTLDNNYSKFRDHKLSLNPADMRRFVTIISDFAKLSKKFKMKISKDEFKNISTSRRTFYTKKDILKNTILTDEHFNFVRPAVKNNFNFKSQLVGKRLLRDLKVNSVIRKIDISK